jgi:sialate O-acetylesterase
MAESNSGLRLPKIYGKGMILQRNSSAKIRGWAPEGGTIRIFFLDESFECKAGADGRWMIAIPTGDAGGPYEMRIACGNDEKVISDIMLGDVWICSGQSNMVLTMTRAREIYPDDVANSSNPFIRQFLVPDNYDYNNPCDDVLAGSWKKADPENLLQFSATAYYFAKALYERYKIPIGAVISCVGGSTVESWMSEEALREFPEQMKILRTFQDKDYLNDLIRGIQERNDSWHGNADRNDPGLSNGISWADPEYDDSEWNMINVPSTFKDAGIGEINGVVWFRKLVTIPKSMTGVKARIYVGRIVDSDTVYINGTPVGNITYQYPPRIYEIPEGLLKEGKNVITVRVKVNNGRGEFIRDKKYQLNAGGQIVDLKGEWKYRTGYVCGPLPEAVLVQCQPVGLFNGMISPLIGYTIKGITWYQGESNIWRAEGYHIAFEALVRDWRKRWAQGDLPFLYVQLPNYLETESGLCWALLRQEQLKSIGLANVGMAVTIDAGEWNDLHPLRKKEVGYRLALLARKIAYADDEVVCSGPIYGSHEIKDGRIVIEFTNTGGGLISSDGDKLRHFEVAGIDGVYVPAEAAVENGCVAVWNTSVKEPVYARYAWLDNPEDVNFYNKEGLPASPFTTE